MTASRRHRPPSPPVTFLSSVKREKGGNPYATRHHYSIPSSVTASARSFYDMARRAPLPPPLIRSVLSVAV